MERRYFALLVPFVFLLALIYVCSWFSRQKRRKEGKTVWALGSSLASFLVLVFASCAGCLSKGRRVLAYCSFLLFLPLVHLLLVFPFLCARDRHEVSTSFFLPLPVFSFRFASSWSPPGYICSPLYELPVWSFSVYFLPLLVSFCVLLSFFLLACCRFSSLMHRLEKRVLVVLYANQTIDEDA